MHLLTRSAPRSGAICGCGMETAAHERSSAELQGAVRFTRIRCDQQCLKGFSGALGRSCVATPLTGNRVWWSKPWL
jgi:hypothetical protein